MIRLAVLLVGLLVASPAFAEKPEYCEASIPLAGGRLSTMVVPGRPRTTPAFQWIHGDRETGEVSLAYEGDPPRLRLDEVRVLVGKAGDRKAANALHRGKDGVLEVKLGARSWRYYWHDARRWADPSWVMIARLDIMDAPDEPGGSLEISFLRKSSAVVHRLTLTAPGGPDLADAARRVLAQAEEMARTGEGCFYREVEVSEMI